MDLGRARLSSLLLAPGQGRAEVEAGGHSPRLCDFRHHLSLFWSLSSLLFCFCWSGDDVLGEMCLWFFTQLCQASSRQLEPMPVKAALGLETFLSKYLLDFSALSTLTAQSRQLTQPLWAHLLLCESAYPLGHCGNHNGVPSKWQNSTCCYKQRGKPAVWPTVLGWPGPHSLPLRGLVVTVSRKHEFV